MNDSRLLLLVSGPNLALWGALFGGASRPPGAGSQAMAPAPVAEPLAMLPAKAPIGAITPVRPPAVVPVRRPRQLRVFQPPAAPVPSRPTVPVAAVPAPPAAVIAAPPPPTPQVPLPAPLEAALYVTAEALKRGRPLLWLWAIRTRAGMQSFQVM